tara:strand:+ start:342 stop:719 length:378 start_codon:yes stop_codon:yes gene_type:complete
MTTTISGSNGIVFPDTTSLSTTPPADQVKAWVNFNGTGTVSIRAGYNVSSISDNGTGDYTVNFTTAMVDTAYAITGTVQRPSNNSACIVSPKQGVSPTTSTLRIATYEDTASAQDGSLVSVAIFR